MKPFRGFVVNEWGKIMRVLLVEDDTSVAKSIELMLQAEGFIVDTTDLGEDGLEIGKIYDYDIIILDLMLPDIDGYEVLLGARFNADFDPVGPFGTRQQDQRSRLWR
jgi:DNA-binding response OmpR family regulator